MSMRFPAAAKPVSRFFYWVTALLVLILDWVSKWVVVHTMRPMQSIQLIGDYVEFTFLRNSGAAFSLLANSHVSWRLFFIGIAIVTIIVLSVLAYREKQAGIIFLLPLGLICGGAAGNMWDRITVGTVVDFIEVGIKAHRFPVFNIADSAVCIGVSWLILVNFRKSSEMSKAE